MRIKDFGSETKEIFSVSLRIGNLGDDDPEGSRGKAGSGHLLLALQVINESPSGGEKPSNPRNV